MKRVLAILGIGCGGFVVVVIVCVVIAAAIGIAGSGNQARSESAARVPAQPTTPPELPGLNEPAHARNFDFTVTKVSRSNHLGTSFYSKDSQGTFLILTVKMMNTSNRTLPLNSWDFTVYDDQNRKYSISSDGSRALDMMNDGGAKSLSMADDVQPGLSRTSRLVFDVVPDARGLQLEVQDGKRISLE